MPKKTVVVNDKMQRGYKYELSQPIGKNFDSDFRPQLSPKEMLALGIFGGVYMRDCRKEFPVSWFREAKFADSDRIKPDANSNYFKVNASQSLREWRKRGWINPIDPRGWFQWYCRYYMGRRAPGYDDLQIKRWRMIRRHIAQIRKNCRPGDLSCRPRQRQAVLHWAYDSRKI